jgi:hypothetical protein
MTTNQSANGRNVPWVSLRGGDGKTVWVNAALVRQIQPTNTLNMSHVVFSEDHKVMVHGVPDEVAQKFFQVE